MPPWLIELWGYGWASAAALGADMWILRSLVQGLGWHYLPASVVAYASGTVVAYVISVVFVFPTSRINSRLLEFGCFALLGIAGVIVNAISLSIAISICGLALIPAKLAAAVCTFTTNFTVRRTLLFSSPSALR